MLTMVAPALAGLSMLPVASAMGIRGVRCVPRCSDLIRKSDVVAMRPEPKAETYRKYRVDVVAWGAGVGFDEKSVARQRRLVDTSRAAGVRLHAADCVAVGEGSWCVISGGDPHSDRIKQFRERGLQAGIDLTQGAVLDVTGQWIRVPWGGPGRNVPMASVFWPTARQWYLRKMDLLAATGATALHIDEPALGSYGLVPPSPGDFSDYAMRAFREWLRGRPEHVWRGAGIESLEGFSYRDFVLATAGDPRAAPLWREFVRSQLTRTAELLRAMRDRFQAKAGRPIPLSTNANPATWYKLPFLRLQDFMTTEVGHEAKRLAMPVTPLLVYKFGDAIGQPVVTTAYGGEWHKMYVDPHPVLVCSWLAMGYGLGHRLMMPVKAWMTPRVHGTDAYRPKTDHFACVARFVKEIAHLLDGYEACTCVGVALGCDAVERDVGTLKNLLRRLADMNVPFDLAVEGNDLFPREIGESDLAGLSAILIACPQRLPADARLRVAKLAGDRPVVECEAGRVPASVPRPIRVDGAERVWVLPRAAPGRGTAPVAIHLLNRDYDRDARDMRAKPAFTVTLDRRLLLSRSFSRAVAHEPVLLPKIGPEDKCMRTRPVAVKQDRDTVSLRLPGLHVWSVVELD